MKLKYAIIVFALVEFILLSFVVVQVWSSK